METKYWKISRDCGFYTRVRVSLKRQDRNKLENRFIEFWYDSFDDENFADYIEVIMKAEWMTKEERIDLLNNLSLIQESLYVEQRKAKIIFNKSGGNAKGNAITNRITIPTAWIKYLNITEKDREVIIKLIDNKIVIEKVK